MCTTYTPTQQAYNENRAINCVLISAPEYIRVNTERGCGCDKGEGGVRLLRKLMKQHVDLL